MTGADKIPASNVLAGRADPGPRTDVSSAPPGSAAIPDGSRALQASRNTFRSELPSRKQELGMQRDRPRRKGRRG